MAVVVDPKTYLHKFILICNFKLVNTESTLPCVNISSASPSTKGRDPVNGDGDRDISEMS